MTTSRTLGAVGMVALIALAACGEKEMPPPVTAEEGKMCVEKATAAYGVEAAYVSLQPMEEDPTGSYAYALPGSATKAAGQPVTFLCRFDDARQFVDIVTYVMKD